MYDLTYRPRRLRTSPEMRDLVRETTLDTTDLIYPLFIVPGEGGERPYWFPYPYSTLHY